MAAVEDVYSDHMVETLTAIAAVVGAVGSVTAGIGVLIVNGKIDRLTGRVDALESTMQTVLTLIAGRPGTFPAQPSGGSAAGRPPG